jgi:hypothetical protein
MRPRDRERESQRSGERELNLEPRGPDPLWTVARTEIRPSSGEISGRPGVVPAEPRRPVQPVNPRDP